MRVLPADIYDTLELSALAFGGIGAFSVRDWVEEDVPFCIYGHSGFATGQGLGYDGAFSNPIAKVLSDVFGGTGTGVTTNNDAVVAINKRKGINSSKWWEQQNPRVSFEEWCKELDVVRGES